MRTINGKATLFIFTTVKAESAKNHSWEKTENMCRLSRTCHNMTWKVKMSCYSIIIYDVQWFHSSVPESGWMEKASWGWRTFTWNSKSMGQLHLRGIRWQTLQTGGREKRKDEIIFLWLDTSGWKEAWLVVWNNTKRQASPQADWRSKNSPTRTYCTTHTHTHTHTPLSEWYGWQVDVRRDVQVIDDRVSMNWN